MVALQLGEHMYDFCVNGAGMVGAATALGLVRQGYRVALIEPDRPQPYNPQQPPDMRVSAISLGSVELLRSLQAWQHIPAARLRAYDTLSVWEGPTQRTDFTASLLQLDALGYFVENRLVQLACLAAIDTQATAGQLSRFESVPTAISWQTNSAIVTLASGEKLEARWVIGADGARSKVRQLAGIGTTGWQYAQQALGVVVETAQQQPDQTWQEFHPEGPRAFLPMYNNYGSFVWYDTPSTIKQLKAMDNSRLEKTIAQRFASQVGPFTVLGKAAFPLARMHAQQYVKQRAILVGDAAHTINPLAGQGVNIGFKDVAALLNVTASSHLQSGDALAGAAEADQSFVGRLEKQYETPRRVDNLAMMSAMDGLYLLFGNALPPIKWLRGNILKVAQHTDFGKRQILRYAVGM